MREVIHVKKATNGIHKFMAIFPDGSKVHFGRQGYSDYTKHRDKERMERYLIRHRRKENWTRSGATTAGFWSRWLLWSSPSLNAARLKTEKVLGKKIALH
jgi:hypothetical protein